MLRSLLPKLLSCLVILAGAFALFLMRGPIPSEEKKLAVTWQTLREAHQWTLYSIDPRRHDPRSPEAQLVQGYDVLGEIAISSADVRHRIVGELQRAVLAAEGPPMACFNPRHAIQVRQGGKVLDVLICFECDAIQSYSDNVRTEAAALRDSPNSLNQILNFAGIRIAP